MAELKIERINKTYKKMNEKANDDISLSLTSGSLVAFTGHNGAGKTTLLSQIVGNTKPDYGDITLGNISFVKSPKSARESVSMMPQFHAPLGGVTVKEAISTILKIRGIKSAEANKITAQTLVNLDIERWKDVAGEKLSGGLQRLTSFAMAVSHPQAVMLLDEPTNDVDPIRRKLIWRHMKELSANGHIVVVVTHNLLEVEQYTDRCIVFNKGRIVRDTIANPSSNKLLNTLFVDVANENIIVEQLPAHMSKQFIAEEGRLIFTLSSEQIQEWMAWVVRMIDENEILSYRLSPLSLEVSYEGDVK